MLLVAIPKSASTSLMHTLGDLYKIPVKQEFEILKKLSIPSEFRVLSKFHSDINNIDASVVKLWSSNTELFKQHVPPTDINLERLKDVKKVILLREPREVIMAYKRADEKNLHKKRVEFKGCKSEYDWLKKSKEIGLYEELKKFYERWKLEGQSENNLVISFEDLISNEADTIKSISRHFNLSLRKNKIKLKKYRYSDYNFIQRNFYEIVEKIKRRIVK